MTQPPCTAASSPQFGACSANGIRRPQSPPCTRPGNKLTQQKKLLLLVSSSRAAFYLLRPAPPHAFLPATGHRRLHTTPSESRSIPMPLFQFVRVTVLQVATSDCTNPLRYGPHWSVLGFQSDDPVTDLRYCEIPVAAARCSCSRARSMPYNSFAIPAFCCFAAPCHVCSLTS